MTQTCKVEVEKEFELENSSQAARGHEQINDAWNHLQSMAAVSVALAQTDDGTTGASVKMKLKLSAEETDDLDLAWYAPPFEAGGSKASVKAPMTASTGKVGGEPVDGSAKKRKGPMQSLSGLPFVDFPR